MTSELGAGKDIIRKILRLREFGVFVSLIVMMSVFAYLSNKFLTAETMASVLTIAAELGIVTLGVAFLMIAGEFDLSVGSVYAITAMTVALLVKNGVSPALAVFTALALATAIGFTNGIITLKTAIPSFITTLGMNMFLRGLLLAITGGFTVSYPGGYELTMVFAQRFFGDFRLSGLWFLGAAIIFYIVLDWTAYGNWVFAVGGNPTAAHALGINVHRVKLINFMISAFMAGLAGIIHLARFRVVEAVAGRELPLEAIAAAVIGGCSLRGGVGSIIGASLGAFLVGMVRVGLVLAGAPAYWYITFIGVILIVAAIINTKVVRA
mgnify:CR=1 FL=1